MKADSRFAHAASRGVAISHIIGFCFLLSFLVTRAFPQEILFTRLADWPIRAVGLWLLVDRFGRYRATKMTAWDVAHLVFVAGFGFILVAAEVFMNRDSGFTNYIEWISQTLNAYIYFLVVREGVARRGFRTDILLRWMLFTLAGACLIAIAQARDIAGMRFHIDSFYHQRDAEMNLEGPSAAWQARGPAVHANSLAIMLICGLPILVALTDLKRVRWFDWACGALFLVTIFMTYSRIGILALFAVGLAVITLLLLRREYYKGAVSIFALSALLAIFVMSVYAFDIQRFKVLLPSSGSITGASAEETVGWKLRQESMNKSIALAERYPFTGLNAASSALNLGGVIVKNAYTFRGLLLNVYVYAFVSYGLLGIAFIGTLFWLMLSPVREVRGKLAFPASMFVIGVACLVAGIAENVLFFDQAMITVNILMALYIMKVPQGKPLQKPNALMIQAA
jgi:hypothetical protein